MLRLYIARDRIFLRHCRLGRLLRAAGFGAGVTGRDGQAQYVGSGACVAGSDGGGELQDFGSENSLRGDDTFEFDELAGVVAAGEAGQEVAVDQPARETDADSDAGLGDGVQLRGTR